MGSNLHGKISAKNLSEFGQGVVTIKIYNGEGGRCGYGDDMNG